MIGVVGIAPDAALAVSVGDEIEPVVGVGLRRSVRICDLGDTVGGVVVVGDGPAPANRAVLEGFRPAP